MNNHLRNVAVLAVAFLIGVASSANSVRANLLLNASFEEPHLTSDIMFIGPGPIGPGWQTPSVVALIRSGVLGTPVTGDGGQHLGLASSSIFQDFELNAVSSYRLTFELGGGENQVSEAIVDIQRNGVSVLGGGAVFSTNGRFFDAKEVVFDSIDAGTYRLLVASNGGYFDAFNLTAVPEPSSILLLGLSLAGSLLVRRRLG